MTEEGEGGEVMVKLPTKTGKQLVSDSGKPRKNGQSLTGKRRSDGHH